MKEKEYNDIKVEQVAIARVSEEGVKLKVMSVEEMQPYIDLFNSLMNTFYMVYELNEEWGDML